jgi:succinate dehydrogenase/fumarate reductase flavoprotein subunit
MGAVYPNFDVVVVGGGGAALMAAYSAARHGRRVILLEKADKLGGTTGLSVGTICATSTRLQRDAGIDDDPQSHFEDLAKFVGPLANRDNLELRRILVDEVPETIGVLCDLGVEFMGPLPEPPHTKPRLHAIVPHSRGYIVHIANACRKLGVDIRTNAKVERLVTETGRVVGVTLTSGEQVMARHGVIIASGDFSSSGVDYKQRYMHGPLLEISGLNPTSTGDGQRMAEEVGAQVVNGDLAWGPEMRFLAPPSPSVISRLPVARWFARLVLLAMKVLPQAMLRPFLLGFVTTFLAPSHRLFQEGAILVNREGQRFCDELNRPQDHFGRQPQQQGFIVFDQSVADRFNAWPYFISTAPGVGYAYLPDYVRSRPDIYASAGTLTELAGKIGLPAAALQEAVANQNKALAGMASTGERKPIETGPFHALGPAQSWIVFCEGGLRINREFRVLNDSGTPIPGLYAAGSAGQGGVILEGHGHHLGWAFTSGRLAGRNAALTSASKT